MPDEAPEPSSAANAREHRARQIFGNVVEIADPQERDRSMVERCGGDALLLARVRRLLDAFLTGQAFLAKPTLQSPEREPANEMSGSQRSPAEALDEPREVGPYTLLQKIGEGGFGVVYLAEQRGAIRRSVAVKVIKPGMDTRLVISRFEAERQALALMDHPGIARVFEAGATAAGRPYFAMELVRGVPITRYCDDHQLDVGARLNLFLQVCAAVQHAHQKGVIHRDLKPSNILVTTIDSRPQPKVIDFGIAKAVSARLTERTLFTEYGQLIGTPEYMSPEQADPSVPDVDTRSDVYSLGVLLYELLVGTTPFDPRSLRGQMMAEMQRVIREVEPSKPSTRLIGLRDSNASVAAVRQIEPARLARLLSGELDWVVMKCLSKDRDRRYESPAALQADLGRYLSGEPVIARPASLAYRTRKFVRRNRVAVAVAAAIVGLLAGGIVTTSWQAVRARAAERAALSNANAATHNATLASDREADAHRSAEEASRQADEARRQTDRASAVNQFLTDMLTAADPDQMLGDRVTVLQATQAAVKNLDDGALSDKPLVEAEVRMAIGSTLQSLGRYDDALPNLRKALDLRRKALPTTAPAIATSLGKTALVLQTQNKTDEAQAMYDEALKILRAADPPRLAELADLLSTVGTLKNMEGNLAESTQYAAESLAMFRKVDPPVPRDIALAEQNYGMALLTAGKTDEAEQILREAVKTYRTAFPPGHPETALAINSLAGVLLTQGRPAEAEPLFRESLEDMRKVLPAGHINLAYPLGGLGQTLEALGRDEEALPIYREALDIRRAVLPPEHPDIIRGIGNVAVALMGVGHLEEANKYYEEALTLARRGLAKDDPFLATVLQNFAISQVMLDHPNEGKAAFYEAFTLCTRVLPPNHPATIQATALYAAMLVRLKELDEAEKLLCAEVDLVKDQPTSVGFREIGLAGAALYAADKNRPNAAAWHQQFPDAEATDWPFIMQSPASTRPATSAPATSPTSQR